MRKAVEKWLDGECETFKPLCEDGESITRKEIIFVHIGAVALLLCIGIIGSI